MFDFYEVGGAIRDEFLGVKSKDVDFVAVPQSPGQFLDADAAFNAMVDQLEREGFDVKVLTPEFFTVRALAPKDHPVRERTVGVDFVLARRDGPSSDGRRPDYVLPGTLLDDLCRRDFTANALARDSKGVLHDYFRGREDILAKRLRFVGDPAQRIHEDGLRVLRGFRFMITKGFELDDEAWKYIYDNQKFIIEDSFGSVSADRIRDELVKMFATDTLRSLDLLANFKVLRHHILDTSGVNLLPTLKQF